MSVQITIAEKEVINAAVSQLRWAPMLEVIGKKRMNNPLDQFKYKVRYLLSRNVRDRFLSKLNDNQFGQSLFKEYPTNFYVPLRSYLDNRFTVKERFEVCLKDIETAKVKFGDSNSAHLLLGGCISLMKIGNFSVDLQMNRMSQHEGFWAINLKDQFEKPISNLTFGFLDSSTILIASVQGAKDQSRNILELNKQLTKDAYGLRPQNLLVAAIQTLCDSWDIKNLIGIDPRNQVKRRINTERQGFLFDYIGFWTELGASKNFSGYWTLSNKAPIKEIADVPSHKRNQYRKRNQMLDSLATNTSNLFKPIAMA